MSDVEKSAGSGPAVDDRRRVDGNGDLRTEQREETGAQQETAPPEPPQAASDAEVERLEEELSASRKKVDDLARAFQSLSQDREEFKQRLSRERERLIDVEKGNVALTLLEAIDELDRCLTASARDESPLAKGVRFIRDGLLSKVQASGIERLNLVGQHFDPNLADAVDMDITTNPDEDQRVVSEVHAGYRFKDRVIRPARVKVAKYVKPGQA